MRSRRAATTVASSPTGARWSATGPPGRSTPSTPIAASPLPAAHGTVHLPARYVAEHVELAYATTAAAAQGRTVDHALLVIDRPCDVRNLYVAMSRGTSRTTPTSPSVASRPPMTSSPAASPATGSTSPPTPAEPNSAANHRIGPVSSTGACCASCWNDDTSSAPSSNEPRHASGPCPAEIRRTEASSADAEQTIAELENSDGSVVRGGLAEYDRPLRRRRHEHELLAARRQLDDIPDRLDEPRRIALPSSRPLLRSTSTSSRAGTILSRRPEIEAEIGAIDDDRDHDFRIRTRVTRREQPEPIVAVLGVRPAHGHGARQWDLAAGELAQHQAAFDLVDVLGPQPPYHDRSAYADSHARVAQLLVPPGRPRQMSIEPPELGLSI